MPRRSQRKKTNDQVDPNPLSSTASGASEFVVVIETAPSGYGCHRGPALSQAEIIGRTNTVIKGPFKSKPEALRKARQERDSSCFFEDWAEEFYGSAGPPFDSRDGENYDNDEEVSIRVDTTANVKRKAELDRKILEKALAEESDERAKRKTEKIASVRKVGRVHYSWPADKSCDIPAELELMLTEEGKVLSSKKLITIEAAHAARVKTLMIQPEPSKERFKQPEQGAVYQDALVSLLSQFTALEELHWHNSRVSDTLLKRVVQETALSKTLHTLSIPLASYHLSPDAVEVLAGFASLRKLALHGSFDMEYGIGIDMGDPYSSDDEAEPEKPYSRALRTTAAALKELKTLDITGHMDFGAFQYILNFSDVDYVEGLGIQVEVGRQEHW